jgi:vacuolar protein sorting-associated protein 13A/C
LGSINLIGNPVTFIDSMSTGIKGFVEKPLEMLERERTMQSLGKGVLEGTGVLAQYTVSGTFNAFHKMAGSVADNFANLTLDQTYK